MRVGLLGGTFDPIHEGHAAAALAAQQSLGLAQIVLVPSRQPPHRREPPSADAADRLAMATLVAREHAGWSVSEIEIRREGPSYTFDTLGELTRARNLAPRDVFFITGADAFAEIAAWSRYPAVLDLAHFVVVARPGVTLADLRHRVPDLAGRMVPAGQIVPERPAGAGDIGARAPEERTAIVLLEADTPHVSSTEIRRRARAGLSLEGMVTPEVAAYIAAHRLYAEEK